MQVVILAGGLGTRLLPLTNRIPKALLPVHGKPFLEYQLRWLAFYGLRNVVLCVGYLKDMVEAFAGDGSQFGVHIKYSTEEGDLLGTAGALKEAEGILDGSFCVLNGDSYLPINPLDSIWHFTDKGFAAMMLTFRNNNLYDRSNVEVENGFVTAYDRNRPGLQFIDYGMRMFRKDVLQWIPSGCFCDLSSLYWKLIEESGLAAYMVSEPFYEIGSESGLARFQEYSEKEKLYCQ